MASVQRLTLLPQSFAIVPLLAGSGLPWWSSTSRGLLAWTRTDSEDSLVCEERCVPHAIRAERGYRALGVDGPLPLGATGILASLAAPLAAAGVPVFVISTFETDYLLVPAERLEAAVGALRTAGHAIAP